MFEDAVKQTGVPKIRLHDTRHTMAARALEAGGGSHGSIEQLLGLPGRKEEGGRLLNPTRASGRRAVVDREHGGNRHAAHIARRWSTLPLRDIALVLSWGRDVTRDVIREVTVEATTTSRRALSSGSTSAGVPD